MLGNVLLKVNGLVAGNGPASEPVLNDCNPTMFRTPWDVSTRYRSIPKASASASLACKKEADIDICISTWTGNVGVYW